VYRDVIRIFSAIFIFVCMWVIYIVFLMIFCVALWLHVRFKFTYFIRFFCFSILYSYLGLWFSTILTSPKRTKPRLDV
jgi:hypothetical protein